MAHVVSNIGKGRVAELVANVVNNTPANSAIVLIPLELSGLASDATLIDYDTVADMLAGATNEQTTMGRKVLTNAEMSTFAVDDTNNRNEASLPDVTWTAPDGNAVGKFCVAYDPDTTGGTDADLIPLTYFDVTLDPDGVNDVVLNTGVFFRAA